MTKYVALLRGINVGGRIIKMADLKLCFEALGFQNVRTVLQTGNVCFEADETDVSELKQQIESALSSTFGYSAKAQIIEKGRLMTIVRACPYAGDSPDFHAYVIFLEHGLARELVTEAGTLAGPERIQLGDEVVYWWVSKGSTLKSPFARYLTRAKYKDFNTNRNLRSLQKLV